MEQKDFSELFVMHFGSTKSEISSRTLGEALISTSIDEINNTLQTEKDISIKVKPFEEGSFEVPFELIELTIASLFATPSVSSIPEIIKILKEFVEIKIQLKGNQPNQIDETGKDTKITTESGDVYNVSKVTGDLIVNNITINDSFNKGIGQLTADKSIHEYSILDSNKKPIISVKEKDFSSFLLPALSLLDIEQDTKEKTRSVPANLCIHKVVFDTTSKWGFIYKGNKISANISDKVFQKKVQTHGRFGKGDILKVLMEIHQVFDETVSVYLNKTYVIEKVFEHIPRQEQLTLF